MALHWDVTKCNLEPEYREINWNKIESLIWLTLTIDIGEITKENLEKVEYRIRLYSRATGDDYSDVISILPKLVGLKTNVSNTSDSAYETKVKNILIRNVREDIRRDRRAKGLYN